MTVYLVGTSGWHYEDWKGIFYPAGQPPARWLPFYAERFQTVELNYSFYQQPTEKAYRDWAKNTPPGFKFAVKASRYITHIKKLRDPSGPLDKFFERAGLLGDKLGPVLYQLPPQLKRSDDLLGSFLQALPKGVRHVFEFRHDSWFHQDVLRLLRKHKAGFCVMDMPGLTSPVAATASFAYVRFHGSQSLYSSLYSREEMLDWAGKIKGLPKTVKTVYIYFNNDVAGYALENARQLISLL